MRQLITRCISQILQTILIIVLLIISPPVIQGEGVEEVGEDFGVGVWVAFDVGLDLVEDVEAVEVEAKVEFLFGLRDTIDEESIVLSRAASFGFLKEFNAIVDV